MYRKEVTPSLTDCIFVGGFRLTELRSNSFLLPLQYDLSLDRLNYPIPYTSGFFLKIFIRNGVIVIRILYYL